jgi:hypothetical protein
VQASVMGFKVIAVSRQEAAMIAAERKLIEIWDMYEFRKAADGRWALRPTPSAAGRDSPG